MRLVERWRYMGNDYWMSITACTWIRLNVATDLYEFLVRSVIQWSPARTAGRRKVYRSVWHMHVTRDMGGRLGEGPVEKEELPR